MNRRVALFEVKCCPMAVAPDDHTPPGDIQIHAHAPNRGIRCDSCSAAVLRAVLGRCGAGQVPCNGYLVAVDSHTYC